MDVPVVLQCLSQVCNTARRPMTHPDATVTLRNPIEAEGKIFIRAL